MAIIQEPFIPGVYAADLNDLNIRTKRETTYPSVGSYKKDDMFPIFEVFPEEQGIVWGRTSSNVNGQPSRFIGLRVNNHIKAHLVMPFAGTSGDADLIRAIKDLTFEIHNLSNSVHELASTK